MSSIVLIIAFIALIDGASIVSRDSQVDILKKDGTTESTEEEQRILPSYISRLGKFSVNFNLDVNSTENDKQNKPFIYCEHYNYNNCQETDPSKCTEVIKCHQNAPTHLLGCMAVSVYNTLDNISLSGEEQPHVKGCWSQDEREMRECRSETECLVDTRRTGTIERAAKFCCCRTHECNRKFTFGPETTEVVETTAVPPPVVPIIHGPDGWFIHILNLALIPFLLICIAIACFVFTKTLRRKFARKEIKQIQTNNKNCEDPLIKRVDEITLNDGNRIQFKDIQLLNEISNGRFGQVYKACLAGRHFAVKIFPQTEEDSWINEMGIYSNKAICGHANIAEFIGGFQWERKYWILTTFYEKASLFDFLKANSVSLPEAVKMISSMLNGIAFLHEEITNAGGFTDTKPTIVHRDLKSKNILVKDDLSTCITDFGLALKCESRVIPSEQNHAQVGTRRYMSPEVLEGATEFSSFAFQQIDVYAAALVMWEVISRTRINEEEEISPHLLPYEKEVGTNPSTNQMRELVAGQKYRPQVRLSISQNEVSAAIVRTMGEMWDHEPDARITSSCARDRARQWMCDVSNITTPAISPSRSPIHPIE